MKDAPIIPTLDLWSLGHSAREIAEMLGFPDHKHVTRIVERARSIGDRRAVLHASTSGRLIGRAGHMRQPPLANVVPALRALTCKRGHPRTRKNLKGGRCRECINAAARAARAAKRGE